MTRGRQDLPLSIFSKPFDTSPGQGRRAPDRPSPVRRQSTPDRLERHAVHEDAAAAITAVNTGEDSAPAGLVQAVHKASASAEGGAERSATATPGIASSQAPLTGWPDSSALRARSARVSHAPLSAHSPPQRLTPQTSTCFAIPATSESGSAEKRKREVSPDRNGAAPGSPESSFKRLRLRGPKSKHTLDGFNFGPSVFNKPALEPPSPLFFSNSSRPRPPLPARFSSSEAAAKMLSKARVEDSHIKTVSLPRGTVPTPSIQPASNPRELLHSSRRSIERTSTGRSNSEDPNTNGELGVLSSIGVIELLEQDERPTFIVDLTNGANYGPGALHTVFANSSLRSYAGLYELVTGTMQEDASPGPKTYLQFKSWLLSASVDGQSLDVCLPSFVYAGMTWSCSTLRKRLRIIAGAFLASLPESVPLQHAGITQTWKAEAPEVEPATHLEPTDYFAGALPPANATSVTPSTKSEALPTIEATDLHMNGVPEQPSSNDLSVATDLLPSASVYVPPREPLGTSASGGAIQRISTRTTVDSLDSQISLAQPDAPSFDWTRLPVTDSMPKHIQFARSVDWASTSLGPIELWSSDLRQMCNLIMASPHPAAMYWGEEFIAIYNEAYVLLAGQKHPKLMGQSYKVAWAEIWDEVKDVFASAITTGEATMKDDDCLFLKRNNYLEETYFSWSIIPMVGRDGSVMGLYNPAFEKTRRKIAERRMLTLREVGERTAGARDVKSFWAQVLGSFEFNTFDSPFLLLYSVADEADSDVSSIHSNSILGTRSCTLEGALGVPEGHIAAPDQIDLKTGMEGFGPVFREVMKTDKPVLLEVGSRDLPEQLLHGLEWRGFGDPARAVVVCPIHPTTGENILGFLVLGVNPRRPYDDDYSLFVQLLSRQLATSLASVVLFEEEIRRGQKAAKLAALDRIELSEQLAARTREAIESETKFTRMAEFAPVGMFIADSHGRIIFANETWYDIGRVPKTAVVDQHASADSWIESVNVDDQPLVRQLWKDLIEHTKSVSEEFRFKAQWEDRHGTRGDTWVLFSAYPETYEDGRLKSIFGSITNISQQKWAENIQTRKMEEAVELKRQQENFIDITSHEMRNPLSAILQCSDEITSTLTKFRHSGDKVLPDELVTSCLDSAQIINLCSQHQKRIVDDILTLSKLDSQLLLVTPVDAQPLTVVQRALKMHEGELSAADIQLKFVVDQTYRDMELDWVRLDPSRVLQVLINLTTNAIKFTGTEKKRTITVTVSAFSKRPSQLSHPPVQYFPTRSKRKDTLSERDWGDGEIVYIHFAVKDTGRGLSPEEKKMLFMRFSQASPRTHVQYGGSGLGLFISRELTELQGGEIGVESEAGKGSTFAFYVAARRSTAPSEADASAVPKKTESRSRSLPNPASPNAPPAVTTAAQASEAPVPKIPKRKVLIVEDNLVNSRVLQKQLRNSDTEVHVANHGGEALEKLRQSTYWASNKGPGHLELGVVLMDQEMPVMDGLTCTRKIREYQQEGKLTGHVPIIAVTANARPEQIKTALRAGMDDVVSKPFRIPELLPKIDELMERYPMPPGP